MAFTKRARAARVARARERHDELVRLAAEADGVTVVSKTSRWKGRSGHARRRSERFVALWFVLAALSAASFVAVYIAWPHVYRHPGEAGYLMYSLYTPAIGVTFGFAVLALSIGTGLYTKRFLPEEVSAQRRPDGPSDRFARETAAARLREVSGDVGLGSLPLLRRTALAAGGLLGLAVGVLTLGAFIRDPWTGGDLAAKWITGWHPVNREKVYLRISTGVLGEIVRVRPEDMEPGTMVTVYPYRQSDRGEKELLLAAERSSDTPVMLIRLRPGTAVRERRGQEDFHYGDFYAFSKVCTHLGCPASLYDTQSETVMCPCHQSQFSIRHAAKPVFGPATRPLPQLPITVDEEGYFIARGDFTEPVGAGFWEVRLNRS